MRYLLANRWQGACLAPALAGRVVRQVAVHGPTPLDNPLGSAGLAAIHRAEALVQLGRVASGSHREFWQRAAIAAQAAPLSSAVPGALAIATLPLILFCHENPTHLDQVLIESLNVSWVDAIAQASTRAFGQAIARLLIATPPLDALIPTLLQGSPGALPAAPLPALQHTQTLVQRRASLHRAIAELTRLYPPEQVTLPLALYCFLSTPTDLEVTMRRAARCPNAHGVCALAAALGGAHNSDRGIPVAWRFPADTILDWGRSWGDLSDLIQRLFAIWSGVNHPDADWAAAIAAPSAPFYR